jgi:hypothetical protein
MSEGLSLAELDMEQATYLPPREVMWGYRSSSSHTVVTNGSFDGGNGDSYQNGLINVSALNGNFSGDFDGSTIF